MKKIILVFGILLLLNISLVLANGDHEYEIEEGRELVESKVNCDELTDEQLEAVGEYYMEQMHPGEAHEAMHKMMGIEEGTEYHEDFHVNIARMMYCGTNYTTGGMMGGGMMMPMMRNMMGGNMMGGQTPIQTNMMRGMMGNYPIGYSYWTFWNLIWVLFWIGIVILIFWLIYKFVIQKGKSESALEILKKRYARGEITKKQFEEMKKELK